MNEWESFVALILAVLTVAAWGFGWLPTGPACFACVVTLWLIVTE